jgi:PKHD-type hydroxylase
MTYNTIHNDPRERACITYPWAYWDDCFSDEELQKTVDFCESFDKTTAAIIGSQDKEEIEKVRKSEITWITRNADSAWIFDKINFMLYSINERYYNFSLNGYYSLQYTTYNAEDEGRYDWHMDMCMETNLEYGETRKLSLTLLLNDDFEGGEFEVNMGKEENAKTLPSKKGRALLFPSFMIHRVRPVTKGVRKSLVAWCVGPKFK